MSYYILPKHANTPIFFNVKTSSSPPKEFISNSLIHYQSEIFDQLFKLFQVEETNKKNSFLKQEIVEALEDELQEKSNNRVVPLEKKDEVKANNFFIILQKYVNNYEFIFSKVPGTKFSVSKLRPQSIVFYELMEVASICNILDSFKTRDINIMNISNNWMAANEFFSIMREEKDDSNIGIPFLNGDMLGFLQNYDNMIYYNRTDLLFFECPESNRTNISRYFKDMCTILHFITKFQSQNGNAIIKIDNIFYKPVFDVLYILSSFYEKVYLLKPNVSNVIDSGRYIICKNFIMNQDKNVDFILGLADFVGENIIGEISHIDDVGLEPNPDPTPTPAPTNKFIHSLINNEMSHYFINKIEESNIVIGQQQLEALGQIISIIKNKNRDEKMETLKKNNIQKCILWCERHQIPYNKFIEKTNIFLPLFKSKNKDECEVEDQVNPYDILTLETACFSCKNSIDDAFDP
jgi:hypothetical protein